MLTIRSGGTKPGSASYTVTSLDLIRKQQQSMLCLLRRLLENDAGDGGDLCSIMYVLAQTAVVISMIYFLRVCELRSLGVVTWCDITLVLTAVVTVARSTLKRTTAHDQRQHTAL
jgi:hypothetical protein